MSETTAEFRAVGEAAELEDNYINPYYLEDSKHRVSVARVGGTLCAFDDLCTCADEHCPLSAGQLTGTTIMCQCHGSQFDVSSGAVIRGPATQPLRTYDVREANGQIEVAI